MNSLRIELFSQGQSMGSHVLNEKGELVIGSAKTADLIVPGPDVAAIHALLRLDDKGSIALYDLGSRSGTYVGKRRIVEEALSQGSSFNIGDRELQVSFVRQVVDPETTLFWQKLNGQGQILHALYLHEGKISETQYLAESGKCRLQTEWGAIAIKRSNGTIEVQLPRELKGSIYTNSGEVLKEAVGGAFSITPDQKLRIYSADKAQNEVQIFWTLSDQRLARVSPDKDKVFQQRAAGVSFALFWFICSLLWFTHRELPKISEEALIPKSEYTRVTMSSSAPAGGPPAESQSEEKSAQAAPAAKPSSAKTSNAINQLFGKILEKNAPTAPTKVSLNGESTARIANASSKFNQQAVAGGVNGGSVNSQAVSAGLQSMGSGGGKGLNGFSGKGTGTGGVGLGAGAGSGAGGLGLNLGSDEAEAVGGLDKALIAAVVQANIGQIKHCYEKQLLIDNSIAGKVVAGWVIDGSGSVVETSIKKTTLNSAPVENCVQARIKTWKFPQPKGGGKVIVSYPFLFKALN